MKKLLTYLMLLICTICSAQPSIFHTPGFPAVAGNAGKSLQTDGTSLSWALPLPAPSSGFYIWNGTSLQPTSNYHISGNGIIEGTLVVGQTATGPYRFEVTGTMRNTSAAYLATNPTGQMSVGATINTSSVKFEVWATDMASIPMPKMTTTQRNAVSNPADGMMIYNITTHRPNYYDGTSWLDITVGGTIIETDPLFDTKFAAKTTTNLTEGSNLYFTNARSRAAVSLTTTGSGAATYNSSTGVFNIPTPVTYSGANFILNGTSVQSANFNINGNGTIGGHLNIGAVSPYSSGGYEILARNNSTDDIEGINPSIFNTFQQTLINSSLVTQDNTVDLDNQYNFQFNNIKNASFKVSSPYNQLMNLNFNEGSGYKNTYLIFSKTMVNTGGGDDDADAFGYYLNTSTDGTNLTGDGYFFVSGGEPSPDGSNGWNTDWILSLHQNGDFNLFGILPDNNSAPGSLASNNTFMISHAGQLSLYAATYGDPAAHQLSTRQTGYVGYDAVVWGSRNEWRGDDYEQVLLGFRNSFVDGTRKQFVVGRDNKIVNNTNTTIDNYILGNNNMLDASSGSVLFSYAIGKENTIQNSNETYTIGAKNLVNGHYMTTFGLRNQVDGTYNLTGGKGNVVSGVLQIVLGDENNLTSGMRTWVLGNENSSNGADKTVLIGHTNKATGSSKTVLIGSDNVTGSVYESFAFGRANDLEASESVGIGTSNRVSGDYSAAIGHGNRSTANHSYTFGHSMIVTDDNVMRIGVDRGIGVWQSQLEINELGLKTPFETGSNSYVNFGEYGNDGSDYLDMVVKEDGSHGISTAWHTIKLRNGTSYSSSTIWPITSDISNDNLVIWFNSTAGQTRLYTNTGGTLHYIDFN